MDEGPPPGSRAAGVPGGDPADVLAARALTVVAQRRARGQRGPIGLLVDILQAAALNLSSLGMAAALDKLRSAGLSNADIADTYIPAVSRRLGDMWCADTMGFAGVTIGTARLQAALHELGPEWRADHVAHAGAPCILIAVASDVYHTLGAKVLTGQMRRAGLSVRLILGARPDDVALLVRRIRFQAVFLSASCGETLESLRKIVDAVRAATDVAPPIVVGGSITELVAGDWLDIAALTGADHVTSDLDQALALCGIQADMTRNTLTETGG